MTKRKTITVVWGWRGNPERVFYDGHVVINTKSRGVLFSGHDSPGNNNGKPGESSYLPFKLIRSVMIEDYDGGMIICNNVEFLSIAIDVSTIYKPEGIAK